MTTNTPPVDVQVAEPAAPREDYLNCSKGIMSWLGNLNVNGRGVGRHG